MTEFLGLEFYEGNRPQIVDAILDAAKEERASYVVTPNVDHVVSYHHTMANELKSQYVGAKFIICDSRILRALARLVGKNLSLYPGSDLTRGLLGDPRLSDFRIAVFGPSREDFELVRKAYGNLTFLFFEAPLNLVPNDPEWEACVRELVAGDWDLALLAVSFPKQEIMAARISAERRNGVSLCIGASLDFLSGKQTRAPKAFQAVGMEWLYRLASNPKRMWRRYLVKGPRIFLLFAKYVAGIPF